jgi:polyisoprenoid-binding protein YceI
MKTRFALACAAAALLAQPALADWQVGSGSQVRFVSIKNNTIGEVSHFETLAGSVTDAGEVEVRVALDSVETNIGIRNERMKKMLFEVGLYPEAVITAQLDCRRRRSTFCGRGHRCGAYKSTCMARQ